MLDLPAALNVDSYKQHHFKQYSPHTEKVYSTWTPRKSRMDGVNKVVVFGLQYFIKDYLIDSFNRTFFNRDKNEVIQEFKRVAKAFGVKDVSHFEALHDLGYLPLKICALEEGTLCPIRVPMFTIENTLPEFYWLTNFVETIMSTEIWKPMTSATIALEYKKICKKWSLKTCTDESHLPFQGHDFSYRGMAGSDAGCASAAGHLLSFVGSDTIPAVVWLERYYNADCEKELVACSIPATEHAVAETNIIELQDVLDKANPDFKKWAGIPERVIAEIQYFDRLLEVYPSGIFSYVADTYNLWEVLKTVVPILKSKILARDGKVVIRPDSGDPIDIICGLASREDYRFKNGRLEHTNGQVRKSSNAVSWFEDRWELCADDYSREQGKGVIELLWDVFGGTVNEKGYKVLDSHIGCIYGDAITLERADEICRRLESKGFASSNIVFGIGSYTYNMNTRDTFGFALKATYGVVNGKELLLYKDPITDDGTKKSQKGRVLVYKNDKGDLCYEDHLDSRGIQGEGIEDLLVPVFEDGKLLQDFTLQEIRDKLEEQLN